MDVQELESPDDYAPTPSVRYNVLRVEQHPDGWKVQIHQLEWDQSGVASGEPLDQVVNQRNLDVLKQIWNAQGFSPVARYHDDNLEVLYYENRADQQRLEAQTSLTLPASLEVWICPTHDMAFKCEIPKTLAFSVRSAEQLAQQGIAHTDLHVTERRGGLTAKVYWLNGQPSTDAQARWQPIIERKVRAYLQTSLSQSTRVFVKGIIEDSVRQGDDARDLIMAHVDFQARLAQLQALDYQPMAE